jgi:hypothetical protein
MAASAVPLPATPAGCECLMHLVVVLFFVACQFWQCILPSLAKCSPQVFNALARRRKPATTAYDASLALLGVVPAGQASNVCKSTLRLRGDREGGTPKRFQTVPLSKVPEQYDEPLLATIRPTEGRGGPHLCITEQELPKLLASEAKRGGAALRKPQTAECIRGAEPQLRHLLQLCTAIQQGARGQGTSWSRACHASARRFRQSPRAC